MFIAKEVSTFLNKSLVFKCWSYLYL